MTLRCLALLCFSGSTLIAPAGCSTDKGGGSEDDSAAESDADSDADSDSEGGGEADADTDSDTDTDTDTDAGIDTLVGVANFQFGFSADPRDRTCDLYWNLSGEARTDVASWCEACLWGFDVEFSYLSGDSNNEGDCVIESDADMTWTLAYHPTYWEEEYGYGAMYYYSPDLGYGLPIWRALWQDPASGEGADGYFVAFGGYYEYGPVDYGEYEDYYYTQRWLLIGNAY